MKKILILKMGNTLKSISEKHGEFPDHIINKSKMNRDEFVIVDCQKEEKLPEIDDIKGIMASLITGILILNILLNLF